jgi:hypothetical protein
MIICGCVLIQYMRRLGKVHGGKKWNVHCYVQIFSVNEPYKASVLVCFLSEGQFTQLVKL